MRVVALADRGTFVEIHTRSKRALDSHSTTEGRVRAIQEIRAIAFTERSPSLREEAALVYREITGKKPRLPRDPSIREGIFH